MHSMNGMMTHQNKYVEICPNITSPSLGFGIDSIKLMNNRACEDIRLSK